MNGGSRPMRRPQFTQAQIDAARETMPLSELIGRQVPLVRQGGEFVGLCPFHNERTGSFTVNDAKGFWHCFGCSAHGDAIAWVRRIDNCSFPEAVQKLLGGQLPTGAQLAQIERQKVERSREELADKQRKIATAWRCWERAQIIRPGDPPWRYLQGRGCAVDPMPETLRWLPDMWHRNFFGADGKPSRRWVTMIARVDSRRGEFSGMHNTYLVDAGDGRFVQDPELKARGIAKITQGDILGGAIRLFPSTGDLDVAEGIEDSLSVYLFKRCSTAVWAMPSHGAMGGFEIPPWVSRLGIYANHDKPQIGEKGKVHAPEGVGMRSARKLLDRARQDRIEARTYWPRDGFNDFNQLWQAVRAQRREISAGSVETVAT